MVLDNSNTRPVTQRWAVVLAAGAGTRLSSLTSIDGGGAVPKQYCSLRGGASLLEETLERAAGVTTPERIIVVVAAEHRRFWAHGLADIPDENIVVQPENRGTAFGILLGVAAVLDRDPDAAILVLPSDHFVANEAVLRDAMRRAFTSLDARCLSIRFLGIRPDSADAELGYIVRGALEADGSYRIAQFVEKPSRGDAERLLDQSALWNSFILVGRARAFVDLIATPYPTQTAALLVATSGAGNGESIDALYARLPTADFSRDVVQAAQAPLKVIPVGACGWSDLGTPQRVADCLARDDGARRIRMTTHLSLADAQLRIAQAAV